MPGIDWPTALRYALPDALLWTLLTPIPVFVSRRFPLAARGRQLAHGLVHLAVAVMVALLLSALDALFNLLRPGESATFIGMFSHLVYYAFHINVLLYFTIVGIAHYLAREESLREERRRASELRAQLSEARLEALRLQLRPHFLFNVLNTISGLMPQDPQTGQRVVRRLGELLRTSLNFRGTREVPLERELELSRAYLEIEQVRFQDRLKVRIEAAEETLACAVPPFILQPLLENAVHHGMPANGSGGTVEVVTSSHNGKLELRVIDDGPGIDEQIDEGGIGIANTRARLQELYGDDHGFRLENKVEGGLVVTLVLPRRRAAQAPGKHHASLT